MSLNLALLLPFAAGYAVEPQHYVSLFEFFGGILPTRNAEALANGIDLFQIESRNPHLHENKGEAHVREMTLSSLSALYHSAVATPTFKTEVETMLEQQELLPNGENLPAPRCYPPLATVASPFQERFAVIQQQYKVPRDSVWNTL
jgi:mannosyl-3-phosphoglycerate synthase